MTGRVGPPFDVQAWRVRWRADLRARAEAEMKSWQAGHEADWADYCGRPGEICADDLRARALQGDDVEDAALRELQAWVGKAEHLERTMSKADRPRASDARALAAARKHAGAFAALLDDMTPQRKLQADERFPAP